MVKYFQSLPVSYVSDMHRNALHINIVLRNICFSIYNEALKHTKPKPLATCLTGFGPISDEAIVLEGGVSHLFSLISSLFLFFVFKQ